MHAQARERVPARPTTSFIVVSHHSHPHLPGDGAAANTAKAARDYQPWYDIVKLRT